VVGTLQITPKQKNYIGVTKRDAALRLVPVKNGHHLFTAAHLLIKEAAHLIEGQKASVTFSQMDLRVKIPSLITVSITLLYLLMRDGVP
jgi:hypothetical protein